MLGVKNRGQEKTLLECSWVGGRWGGEQRTNDMRRTYLCSNSWYSDGEMNVQSQNYFQAINFSRTNNLFST